MQTKCKDNKIPMEQIESIYKLINEVKCSQTNEILLIKEYCTINTKKLDRIQECSKITDINNQLLNQRLEAIEHALKELNKVLMK